MKNKTLTTLFLLSVVMAGCATSPKVQVVDVGDEEMSCRQLASEMNKLDKAQADVDDKKGVTGTNVASAIFWLPGLAYTYYDAGQATDKINERRSHLAGLFSHNKCDPALITAKK